MEEFLTMSEQANDVMTLRRVALFNDTSRAGHYGCELVMREIERYLSLFGCTVVWRHYVGEDWREEAHALENSGADLVVVNGEGTIHHSATWHRAHTLSMVGPYARDVLMVPSFLINATIHEISEATAVNIRAFDFVYVRDSSSKKELERFAIVSQIVPDITLAAPATRSHKLRNGYCYAGSVLPDVENRIFDRGHQDRMKLLCVQRDRYMDDNPPKDVESFTQSVSMHESMLTGRFHAVTICLLTRTPFVALESNTPKISALLKDIFGKPRRIIQPHELQSIDLAKFSVWRLKERVKIDLYLFKTRRRAYAMFHTIALQMSKPRVRLKSTRNA